MAAATSRSASLVSIAARWKTLSIPPARRERRNAASRMSPVTTRARDAATGAGTTSARTRLLDVAAREEGGGETGSDETGGAGDEHAHGRSFHVRAGCDKAPCRSGARHPKALDVSRPLGGRPAAIRLRRFAARRVRLVCIAISSLENRAGIGTLPARKAHVAMQER